jgi:ABC-type nitrate/sulfonate/bicarbonate transport system substrate-binding protein
MFVPVKHRSLNPYAQVYFSERTLIMKNRPVFANFLAACNAGWLSVCANPHQAARLIAQAMVTPGNADEQQQMLERVIPLVTGGQPADRIGTIEPVQWRRNLRTYAQFGLIDRPVDLHDVVVDLGIDS